MACKYKVKGTDTWVDENQMKEMLHKGLLDKLMLDNNISITGIKPKKELADSFSGATTATNEKTMANSAEEAKRMLSEGYKPMIDGQIQEGGESAIDNLFNTRKSIEMVKPEGVSELQAEERKTLLEESINAIDSMKEGETLSIPNGTSITKRGTEYNYKTPDGGTRSIGRDSAIQMFNNNTAKANAGKNISLNEYETETVKGNNLKVGDVFVRDVNGTRYVYKLLESPRRDRSRGNFWNAKVEVLHIGNQPTEILNTTTGNVIGTVNENEKQVGKTTIDTFKSQSKDSAVFGNVKKINNWESKNEPTQEDVTTEKSISEKAKGLADAIRKGKIDSAGSAMVGIVPIGVFNKAIEGLAITVENVGKIIENIKASDWYKALDDKMKSIVDKNMDSSLKKASEKGKLAPEQVTADLYKNRFSVLYETLVRDASRGGSFNDVSNLDSFLNSPKDFVERLVESFESGSYSNSEARLINTLSDKKYTIISENRGGSEAKEVIDEVKKSIETIENTANLSPREVINQIIRDSGSDTVFQRSKWALEDLDFAIKDGSLSDKQIALIQEGYNNILESLQEDVEWASDKDSPYYDEKRAKEISSEIEALKSMYNKYGIDVKSEKKMSAAEQRKAKAEKAKAEKEAQKQRDKEFKENVAKATGTAKNQEQIIMSETEALKKQLRDKARGGREAVKSIQDIKTAIKDHIKASLPKATYTAKEVNSLVNAVTKAKTDAQLEKVLDRVDALVEKKIEDKRKKTVKDIKKKVGSKKTLLSRVNNKWKGKTTVDAQQEFKEFIESEALEGLEEKTQEELDAINDVLDGIVNTGKADFKAVKAANDKAKRIEAAKLIKGLAKTPDTILGNSEAIESFLDDGGSVIVDGQLYSKTSFKEWTKANPLAFEGLSGVEGYKQRNISFVKGVDEAKSKKKRWLKVINPLNSISDLYSLLKDAWGKNPDVKKFIDTKIAKPIKNAYFNELNGVAEKVNNYNKALSDIFGSKRKGTNALSQEAKVNAVTDRALEGKSPFIITNSHLVNYYNLSRIKDGVERLRKSGVDTDAVAEYIESNPELKAYADYLIETYNGDLKESYEGVYIDYTGKPFPEGVYYPSYASNFDDDFVNENSVMGPEGSFNAMNAVSNNMKDKTNFQGPFDISLDANRVMMDYIKNMEHAKNFMPIAKSANELFSKINTPYLIENMGNEKYRELKEHLAIVLSGKNPFSPSSSFSKFVNRYGAFNVIATLGFKPASILKQYTAFTHFWTAGIQDGLNPIHIMAGTVPKTANERQLWMSLVTSPYIKNRLKGGNIDLETKRIVDNAGKSWNKKVWDVVMKVSMSPIIAGDAAAILFGPGGGSAFAIAVYRSQIAKGATHEEAMDYASRRFVEEAEATQQTSRADLTSNVQRDPYFRMLGTYRTGQMSMAKKILNGVKTLQYAAKNKEGVTNGEKVQAITDILYYTLFGSMLFAAVSSGAIKRLWEEEEKKNEKYDTDARVGHDLALDQLQGTLQGFGAFGYMADWMINNMRGDKWKNNAPVLNFIELVTQNPAKMLGSSLRSFDELSDEEKVAYRSKINQDRYGSYEEYQKMVSDYDNQFFYSKMNEEEQDLIVKSIGLKNINDLVNNFGEWLDGDKTVGDALMNWEKDYLDIPKKKHKKDLIFEWWYNEPYIKTFTEQDNGQDLLEMEGAGEEIDYGFDSPSKKKVEGAKGGTNPYRNL